MVNALVSGGSYSFFYSSPARSCSRLEVGNENWSPRGGTSVFSIALATRRSVVSAMDGGGTNGVTIRWAGVRRKGYEWEARLCGASAAMVFKFMVDVDPQQLNGFLCDGRIHRGRLALLGPRSVVPLLIGCRHDITERPAAITIDSNLAHGNPVIVPRAFGQLGHHAFCGGSAGKAGLIISCAPPGCRFLPRVSIIEENSAGESMALCVLFSRPQPESRVSSKG